LGEHVGGRAPVQFDVLQVKAGFAKFPKK
jgi:hypothetical protein